MITDPEATSSRYLELEVPAGDVDLTSGILWDLGVVAIEEVTLECADGGERTVLLRTTPADDGSPEDLLSDVLDVIDPVAHRIVSVADAEWLDAWRDHARAEPVGERLWLRPAWLTDQPPPDGRIELSIDPGRAFGSGSHQSTRLALELIERSLAAAHPVRDPGPGSAGVLDVGCGSGVLGIAALLLGAEALRAIDVDAEAIPATAANAADNGVAERVEVDGTPVAELSGSHDLVVANILAPVLVELAADLVARTADDGRLVLAGFLDRQADRVLAAVETAATAQGRKLQVVDRLSEAGWSACTLLRRG